MCPSRMVEIFLGCAVLRKMTGTDFGERAEGNENHILKYFLTLLKCKPVRGVRFVFIYDGNEEQFLH